LNLAYGETYAIAGLAVALLVGAGAPGGLASAAALALAVVYTIALDRFVLQPRSHWPVPMLILVTLGVAFVSRGVLLVLAGIDPLSFPRLVAGKPLRWLGGALPPQGLLLIVVGIAAAFAVTVFLARTRIGKQLRACAANPDAAQLLGVNVGLARSVAFGIAGLLGGLAAVLLVPLTSVDFQAGLAMTLRGFIAAALAGMVPSRGVPAGLCLGLFEAFVSTYVDALAQDPIVFLVLIGIALWQSRKIRHGGGLRA
ncbi:MAG: branched-chain amino acid transporter permease, partial [Ramlibacter sp.]|nr:branched-chain amino acid transporter permease [Ramlibacter sp.]